MMNFEDAQDIIAAYLKNELSPEERAQFEQQLATDEDWASELALYKAFHHRDTALLSVSQTVKQLIATEKFEPDLTYESPFLSPINLPKKRLRLWYFLLPVLGISMAIGGLIYVNSKKIPAEVKVILERPFGNIMGFGKDTSRFVKAMRAYDSADYNLASKDLDEYLTTRLKSDDRADALLYLGETHRMRHNFVEAQKQFEKVFESDPSNANAIAIAQSAAHYLLGLTWLQQGEIEKAQEELRKVADDYEAKTILDALEKK